MATVTRLCVNPRCSNRLSLRHRTAQMGRTRSLRRILPYERAAKGPADNRRIASNSHAGPLGATLQRGGCDGCAASAVAPPLDDGCYRIDGGHCWERLSSVDAQTVHG